MKLHVEPRRISARVSTTGSAGSRGDGKRPWRRSTGRPLGNGRQAALDLTTAPPQWTADDYDRLTMSTLLAAGLRPGRGLAQLMDVPWADELRALAHLVMDHSIAKWAGGLEISIEYGEP